MSELKEPVEKQEPDEAQTFGAALGQAVWLMTLSKPHRELPVREIEGLLATPILLKQFKLYSKGKQPVAFLSWAMVSDEIKARFEAGNKALELKEWRSGPNLILVECISPFNPPEVFTERFREGVRQGVEEARTPD